MGTLGIRRATVALLVCPLLGSCLAVLVGCLRQRPAFQAEAWSAPWAGNERLLPVAEAQTASPRWLLAPELAPIAGHLGPDLLPLSAGTGAGNDDGVAWAEPGSHVFAGQLERLPPIDSVDGGACFEPRLTTPGERLRALAAQAPGMIRCDYGNFYSWPTMRDLLLAVSLGSVLANTSLDQDFRDWYQERVHTRDLNRVGLFWKTFGEGAIFIPSYAALAVAGAMCEDVGSWGMMGEFGARVTRGYAVGAPPLVFGQLLLGGSRPSSPNPHSYWTPFEHDNGMSGHAFIGAVPFITAARMTDDPWWKGTIYCLSVLPAWSRIEGDKHYLSQVILGWWMAYLASRAVDQTEQGESPLSMSPVLAPGFVGVGVTWRR